MLCQTFIIYIQNHPNSKNFKKIKNLLSVSHNSMCKVFYRKDYIHANFTCTHYILCAEISTLVDAHIACKFNKFNT